MLSQRVSNVSKRKKITTAKRPSGTSKSPGKIAPNNKRKMSYKDKHTLETLPAQMEEMQQVIERHQSTLSDPNLFKVDPDAYAKSANIIKSTQLELQKAEEKWLELEILREQIERR